MKCINVSTESIVRAQPGQDFRPAAAISGASEPAEAAPASRRIHGTKGARDALQVGASETDGVSQPTAAVRGPFEPADADPGWRRISSRMDAGDALQSGASEAAEVSQPAVAVSGGSGAAQPASATGASPPARSSGVSS